VSVPKDAEVAEPTEAILWVRVSRDGHTLDLRPKAPSNDAAFEREVEAFARAMAWVPATKAGAPVDAWVQMLFKPAS
jgi:outer membrane biosynthesis protein TonB